MPDLSFLVVYDSESVPAAVPYPPKSGFEEGVPILNDELVELKLGL